MTTEVNQAKVITGKVRFSYLHVFEPVTINDVDGEKKYSVSLIIPKSDKATLKAINGAIAHATEQAKAKFGGKLPPANKFKLPLRDGDEERPDDEAYEDSFFLNATAKTKPGVVNKDLSPIMSQDELYSGCYGRASITFFPFDTKGNKGIACGLNNLMKLENGENLGGRVAAEVDFKDFAEEDLY